MPHVLIRFADYDMTELVTELGGILCTPSVLIDCLISKGRRSSLYSSAVHCILGRATDYLLKSYIIKIDEDIVRGNLTNAKKAKLVTFEEFQKIQEYVASLKTLKCSQSVEEEANKKREILPLYDARRIETAFQHGLTILTCEPEYFTNNSDEREHIFKYGYADICIGSSELFGGKEEEHEDLVKVWVFTPEAFSILLNRYDPHMTVDHTDRTRILSLTDFNSSCNLEKSCANVCLTLDDTKLYGNTEQTGPIDAVLRSIEDPLREYINFEDCDVHLRISDTTTERDTVTVHLEFSVPHLSGRYTASRDGVFRTIVEGDNTLLTIAQAYVGVLNTVLKIIRDNDSQLEA